MKLTNTACINAKPKDRPYKMFDGAGLYLHVFPNGSKYWRLKYRFAKKEKVLALGIYPLTSLAQAREKREDAKRLLAQGINPALEKKKEERATVRNAQNTFKAVALEWHEKEKPQWSKKHADNILHRLNVDIFPYIGNDPIGGIEAPTLLDALKKIEKRQAYDIAGRARSICSRVFRYGIQIGKCIRNPAEDLKGALKTKKTKHFAALDTHEIPDLLEAIEHNKPRLYPQTVRAIKLSMLTLLRPNEIRYGKPEEIDRNNQQWLIPGSRMKMNRDHIVPLSAQALQIIDQQLKDTEYLRSPWLFPGFHDHRKPISENTVNVALQNLGFKGRQTAHGFRALGRTAIREELNYDPDVIEVQLAHKPKGPLGAAYDRAQFLNQRRIMMQDWADYLARLLVEIPESGKVIIGSFRGK